MFRIGDFSRLTQVTVKALRHYDRLGLLKPERIDPESGYRYYSGAQLPRLNRILALKDLGFSLEQVSQLLDADLSPNQLHSMLRLKQEEVSSQIEAEQYRLARIEARLRQLDRGVSAPGYDVVLKRVPEQPVASLRGVLPSRSAIGRLFRALHQYELRRHLNVTARTTIWHETEFHEQGIDAEATFATADAVIPEGGVAGRILPAVETMACVIHQGTPETIGEGCQALLAWIEANDYELDGPERVVMLQRGGPAGAEMLAEMQFPVRSRV